MSKATPGRHGDCRWRNSIPPATDPEQFRAAVQIHAAGELLMEGRLLAFIAGDREHDILQGAVEASRPPAQVRAGADLHLLRAHQAEIHQRRVLLARYRKKLFRA
jgi:hypothetical protein